MSFDLHFFVPPGPGETWDSLMDRLEVESVDPSDGDEELRAKSVLWAVSTVPENGENFDGELFTDATGEVLFTVFAGYGEVSIAAPYWATGARAAHVVQRLEATCRAVELATGLVAFDPQAGLPFLDGGSVTAVDHFDRVGRMFAPEGSGVAARSRLAHVGRIATSFAITALLVWLASLAVSMSVGVVLPLIWFGSILMYELLFWRSGHGTMLS